VSGVTTLRRLSPLVGAVVVGFVALLWVLARLIGVFVDERDDARHAARVRLETLTHLAARDVGDVLLAQLDDAEARVAEANDDPRVDLRGVVVIERGLQRVPPPRGALVTGDAPGRTLLLALRSDTAGPSTTSAVLTERIVRARRAVHALETDNSAILESSVRAFLSHSAHHVLPADETLAVQLYVIGSLVERPDAARELLDGLLRDGLSAKDGSIVHDVQRALLRALHELSGDDVAFFAAEISAYAARALVRFDDFARALDVERGLVFAEPASLDAPLLLRPSSRGLYVTRARGTRVVGVAIDLAALVQSVEARLEERGLLEPSATLVLGDIVTPTAMTALPLTLRSPAHEEALELATARFVAKGGLAALAALLGALVAVLGVLFQRRRLRFVELKSDFVAAVSHELKTPLSSIRLMAETLERRVADNPRARDYPARILKDVDGLVYLVENILSFSRIDKWRWVLHEESVDLSELLADVRDAVTAQLKSPLAVHIDVGADVCLRGDPELLHLLFANLFRNARQYNVAEQAEVSVTVDVEAARILVRDNGVGISAASRARVFEAFFRAAPDVTGAVRGSGLGLSLCARIATLHGGGITIDETGPDGTVFAIALGRERFSVRS
jgi:two-component system sensor histidine kinase SenX3